jgi:ParB family chromosome partitioning protein
MASIRDKYMAATANIPNAKDIKVDLPAPGTEQPVTTVGSHGQLQVARQELRKANEKVAALEERLAAAGTAKRIPCEMVRRNPWQPRIKFDVLKLTELAESIKEIGQLQAVLVREKFKPNGELDFYELIAGERRWRAHELNGMPELLAVVTKASDADMAIMALAENISRDDLDDYEIAKSVRMAEKEFKKRSHLAEALGISRGNMYRFFAFGDLPEFITHDLEEEPGLLGGNAANEIAKVLKRCRESSQEEVARAEKLAHDFWKQLKSGSLDQGKFAVVLESALQQPEVSSTAPGAAAAAGAAGGAEAGETPSATANRDIRKIFAGKAQAGSITKDATNLTIKLKSTLVTPAKEARLRQLIAELFAEDQ